MADLPSILGGMAQGFLDFGKSAVDLFGTGGAAVGDLVDTIRTGKVSTKNQDDFRKWLYNTDSAQDAAAKGLGTALNGVQTVSDYIPGIGAVTRNPLFNAGQGALGGLADEFKMYGKDYDLGRAGQRAAVGAGGALASTGLADALKGSGNALLKSGTAQGLARGAVGGAIGAGGYTAIDGGSLGDVANSALQGAGMGAAIGGATGALQDFKPARTYDLALTDDERQARLSNIDDQLSRLDTSTPEGNARYNELMNARGNYADNRKAQFDLLQKTNPMRDDYHTGIRSPEDIYTLKSIVDSYNADNNFTYPDFTLADAQKALASGNIDVYSSKPIEAGAFISPSKMMATDYAGGGEVYTKNIPLRDFAFIESGDEGNYLPTARALETTLANDDMAVNSPRYITDENGNPRTFYHGSPNKNITEFDINQAGKNTSSGERALYFTDSPEVADEFSYERLPSDSMFVNNRGAKGRVYPVNLEMNNPLDLDNLTDAQIRELWEYASPLGQLDGQEKFIKNLTEFRDAAHNGQLTKTLLDLDKLKDSQYDGFMARMYPNQDNQAREYAVFDNSKVKMLEDVLANDDAAVNGVMESRIAPGQLGLFDDMPTQAPKTAGKQASLFDQPQEGLDYYGEDIEAPATKTTNPYAPVDGKLTQAMKDRYWELTSDANQFKYTGADNDLYNRINPETLPKGYKELQHLLDTQDTPENMVEEVLKNKVGTDSVWQADTDKLLDYVWGGDNHEKKMYYKSLEDAIARAKKNAVALGIDDYNAEEEVTKAKRQDLQLKAYQKAELEAIDKVMQVSDTDDIVHALSNYRRRGIRTGEPGALDTVLSERLGIAPGNTIKITKNVGGDLSKSAAGRYARNARDIAIADLNSPEGKVSTMAHERLHSFQNEARPESAGRYDPEVAEAYKQLQKDLGHYYKSNSEIKKRYGRNVDYWASSGEQESRMFQQYLENKGYTDNSAWRKMGGKADEWGNEINPAFDKFIDKLRDLSKRGVALPALAALFGGGAYMASQNNDKEKEVK